jgi:pimeloyl-ACP methyl ester carboxylesterase
VHFEETPGREPPVVLLHHGANTLRAWDSWIAQIGGGRRVIAYDRRGFGGSARDAVFDARLFHRDADDLAELLRELGAAPAHLVGHSDGATVALLTAALHPDLVLSATWIAGHTNLEEPLRRRLLESKPKAWPKATVEEYRDRHGDDWEQVIANWYELWTVALVGWDIERDLAAIRAPTLVVHDRRDVLAPPPHAESVARAVPHAQLSWYDTGSHGPHRAERERFERELEAHLRSAERAAT